MIPFWSSHNKLTDQGLKIAWFGVFVSCLGLAITDVKWFSWFGPAATAVVLFLRQRAEHLKKVDAEPRKLKPNEIAKISEALTHLPKEPLSVGFFGQDLEAEQFAIQIKATLESVGFKVVRLEGFMVFKPQFGLTITTFNSESNSATAIAIADAFTNAGHQVEMEVNPNKCDPAIALNVHGKPPMSKLRQS
jgi:hypothetical protein